MGKPRTKSQVLAEKQAKLRAKSSTLCSTGFESWNKYKHIKTGWRDIDRKRGVDHEGIPKERAKGKSWR